jgi:hypothetical protein
MFLIFVAIVFYYAVGALILQPPDRDRREKTPPPVCEGRRAGLDGRREANGGGA